MNDNEVFNYVSPPFNPGVRTWKGVKPERAVVQFQDPSPPNFDGSEIPVQRRRGGCKPVPSFSCGYPHSYSPPVGGEQVEGFGTGDNLLINLLILAIIIYLIYHIYNENSGNASTPAPVTTV